MASRHDGWLLTDIGLGLIGGYAGTKVMAPVTTKLYEWESEEDRRREERARSAPAYEVAAGKTAAAVEALRWLGRRADWR